jgi:hypothetical protein
MVAILLSLWALWTAVVLAVCAITGFYISAEKGRGCLEGFVLGLIFGPFGLLLAVLMPEPERRVTPIVPPSMAISMAFIVACLALAAVVIVANQPAASPAARSVR